MSCLPSVSFLFVSAGQYDKVNMSSCCKICFLSDIVWCWPWWPVSGVGPGSELTGAGAGALSAAQHSPVSRPGQARAGWPGQDGVGTTLPAQLSVPGIATIASVATTMARVAADTDLGHVLPFMLLWQSAYNHTHIARLWLKSDTSWNVGDSGTFSWRTLIDEKAQANKIVNPSYLSTLNNWQRVDFR